MTIGLILFAVLFLALSGLPAVLLHPRSNLGARLGAALNVLACLLAFAGLFLFARCPDSINDFTTPWALPFGAFEIGIDSISAVFLIPIFVVSALGSIYGLGYWSPAARPGSSQKLRLCWGLLAASMALVVLARNAGVLLLSWEIMALAAFILIATEDYKPLVRTAGWIYLVATHVGTLCLIAFFILLHKVTDSYDLWHTLPTTPPSTVVALLVLGLLGFGLKAGLMPLHVWLPGAHANAPSHVSAILSGVMLKIGIYGIFRVTGIIVHPPVWCGILLLSVGTLSALLGIVFAVAQQDFKRLLAYSSIENIGIISMGLGLALLGRSFGRPDWIILGLGAALFHVLNHSLFKPLLFMGAGALLHAVHTRRMDRLGGLARQMPRTFILVLVGSIAICGLPPLNGFASEFLLYIGLLKTISADAPPIAGWAAFAIPALGAVGAAAIYGFVKLLGSIFSGLPRTAAARHAHEPANSMFLPMLALAIACVVLGLVPLAVLPLIEPAIQSWSNAALPVNVIAFAPSLPLLTVVGAVILVAVAIGTALVMRLLSRRPSASAGTWDCGYAAPTSRMQYTGTSFSQSLVELFAWALWPRAIRVRLRRIFPGAKAFASEVPDTVLDRALLPAFGAGRQAVALTRVIQQGSMQAYLVYILAILMLLILLG